jgi:hypothetical protein
MALFTEASSSSARERVPAGFFEEDLRQGREAVHAYSAGLHSAASTFQDNEDIEPDLKPLTLPSGCWTLLPAIEACDNTRLPQGPFSAQHFERERGPAGRDALGHGEASISNDKDEEVLLPFFVKESDHQPIGFLRPSIVEMLELDNTNAVTKMKSQPCWKMLKTAKGGFPWAVAFEDWINQSENPFEVRSEHMDRLARGWKQEGRFPEELKGDSTWRNGLCNKLTCLLHCKAGETSYTRYTVHLYLKTMQTTRLSQAQIRSSTSSALHAPCSASRLGVYT